jgi:hypothetical protein
MKENSRLAGVLLACSDALIALSRLGLPIVMMCWREALELRAWQFSIANLDVLHLGYIHSQEESRDSVVASRRQCCVKTLVNLRSDANEHSEQLNWTQAIGTQCGGFCKSKHTCDDIHRCENPMN